MLDVYRQIANQVGTNEAVQLAQLLNAWHDTMVKHRRRLQQMGFDPDGHRTWEDCPHADAVELWNRAREVFGARAEQLEFLRAVVRTRGTEVRS